MEYVHRLILWVLILSLVPGTQTALTAQAVLQGRIYGNARWSHTLYISELTNLSRMPITDSIALDADGRFLHVFTPGQQQAGLIRLILPPAGSSAYTFLDGPQENIAYIVVPREGEVYLEAEADRFFYSHQLHPSTAYAELMALRDLKTPFLHFLEQARDSIALFRESVKPTSAALTDRWLEELSQYRTRLGAFLQRNISDTLRLLGLHYYYQSLLGRYDWNVFGQVMRGMHSRELPLYRFLEREYQRACIYRDTAALAACMIEDTSGQMIRFGSLRADYLVLDFWASWCGPCRMANRSTLPALQEFCRKSGILFIGVSADTQFSTWQKALKVDRLEELQFRDVQYNGGLTAYLGIRSFPTYLVLDKNREVLMESASDAEIAAFIRTLTQVR